MTNITLQRGGLRDACQGFSKIIGGKSTLPLLGCVRFRADGNGVTAQATDLDQVLDCQLDRAEVRGDGDCIIPFSTLKDLAKGCKDESVEIEAEDPLNITVTNHVGGHAVRRPVTGMDLDEWPSMVTDIPTKPASAFAETYRRLTPFSSTDETRHVLNSVFVEVGKGENPVTMVSTDGRRLAAWNSMALPIQKSIVVPTTKFLNWTRLPPDVEIGVREDNGLNWLGVKAGAFTYTVKCIEGTYPNYRQVIPQPGPNVMTFTDSDVDLLKQVLPTFPGDDGVTIVGGDGKVTLYGSGVGDEATSLTLESTTYVGDRMFVGVDRSYLLDAMLAGFRAFSINDELSPLLSRDTNGGTHVLMPVRVIDPEEASDSSPEVVAGVEKPEADEPTSKKSTDEPAAPVKKPTARRKQVTTENDKKNDTSAMDRVLAACEVAKSKVKETGQSLSELATAIRDAAKEQKVQSKEVEAARVALAKLQQISL